jgi:hypothetical protein
MLTVEGVYRNGQIELPVLPAEIGQSRVLVTFLEPVEVDLAARGIDPAQAADLRARLSAFAEDWERPEMDIYDAD